MLDTVADHLRALGLEPQPSHGALAVGLPSERRGAVTVVIRATESGLALRAFVLRNPDRAHEAVYHRILRVNFGPLRWRFALDPDDDVFLAADLAAIEVTADALDRLLGEAVTLIDDTFEGLARTGFDIPEGVPLRPPPPDGD